ncbi:98203409-70d5-416d-bc2a-2bfce39db832 [Thermothielavioides terrestris]|uniref:98203409-70d5-416d-bc2a-2bfce39db832 n=1 Tax=Thermothielavioides terrestris TaxID=2587410 RepID=A0A3S4F5P2_9PEZI|nr:98203409-70d5-416d-bc2a-2bfce39db832 [Thermothielavioides terrestris]
MAWYWANF